MTETKKNPITIQIYSLHRHYYTFELIFRCTSLLPLPRSIRRITRFPERSGQLGVITAGTCARQRSNYSARSLSFGCGMAGAPWGTRTPCTRGRVHTHARVPSPKREKRRRAVDNRRWRKRSLLLTARYGFPFKLLLYTYIHTTVEHRSNRRKSGRVSFRLTNRGYRKRGLSVSPSPSSLVTEKRRRRRRRGENRVTRET